MRRTLFRKSDEVHPPARSSVREVLLFDVRDHSDNADQTLAERRLGAWIFAPWLLLAGHVAIILSVFFDIAPHLTWKSFVGAVLPLMAALAVDAVAGLIVLYWQAKKALNIIDEFENSGRGWFWETDSLGTLSYVSRQLADDFQCEPEALLGRQFTDLVSVDHAPESTEEGKTLGFHLSARFPFSDVDVRPASEQDVHWSLPGNPIF